MSLQAAETQVTYAQLLVYATGLEAGDILWGPTLAAGTRIWLRKNGFWKAFLITNLTLPATQTVTGTVTANQGTAIGLAGAWPVEITDGASTAGLTTLSGIGGTGLVVYIGDIPTVVLQSGSQFNIGTPVVIGGVAKTRQPTNFHITANGTNSISGDLWLSSLVIVIRGAGTGSTVTIQDKGGTPKILVDALVTTALSQLPSVLSFDAILMSGGIDIITAGAVAATVDIFLMLYQ